MPTKDIALAEELRRELLEMAAEDLATRERLIADGSLFAAGYHPEMEAVHNRNAARLKELLDASGWPGRSRVGDDGASAAWLILQHAIGHPALQRRGLELLRQAAGAGEVALDEVARLEDRIRLFEGRLQLYGTHFDWDEAGQMSPLPIEDEAHVDERRAAMDLPSLLEQQVLMRAAARTEGQKPPTPAERAARAVEFRAWAERQGWRA